MNNLIFLAFCIIDLPYPLKEHTFRIGMPLPRTSVRRMHREETLLFSGK